VAPAAVEQAALGGGDFQHRLFTPVRPARSPPPWNRRRWAEGIPSTGCLRRCGLARAPSAVYAGALGAAPAAVKQAALAGMASQHRLFTPVRLGTAPAAVEQAALAGMASQHRLFTPVRLARAPPAAHAGALEQEE
jgi:hypothetical protein